MRKALRCLEAEKCPEWRRVVEALQCFSGLALSSLPGDQRERMEGHFLRINEILARYRVRTREDYRRISPEKLDEIELHIRAIAEECACGAGSRHSWLSREPSPPRAQREKET